MAAGSFLLMLALPLLAAKVVPDKPSGLVYDERIVSEEARSRLSTQLSGFERDSGHQFIVALFSGLEGESSRDYSARLLKAWRPELLLAYFKAERSWRVETGSALSPTLGSLEGGMLVEESAGTWLRQDEVDAGIEVAVGALIGRLSGRLPPRRDYPDGSVKGLEWETVAGACVLLLLMTIVVITRSPYRRHGRVTRDWERGGVLHDGEPWSGGGTSGRW